MAGTGNKMQISKSIQQEHFHMLSNKFFESVGFGNALLAALSSQVGRGQHFLAETMQATIGY